ncbi:MAG: ATP-binding protein [Acidimicrobiales bacterium]
MRDPFKPSFGVSPPLLVGRQELIDVFADGIDAGPGAMARATLYTGPRGTGKTVLLNTVEDAVRARGWLVISETAIPGLVGRLTGEHLPALLAQYNPKAIRSHLSGITIPGGFGANWTSEDVHRVVPGLRGQLFLLAHILAESETGILLTVDEIGAEAQDELRELTTVVQHAFREELDVAFVGAGLPGSVADLLQDEVITFLRRADRHSLGSVDIDDVRRALREPIESAGRTVDDAVLEKMADGTAGYPFLIQLVGSSVWKEHPDVVEMSMVDAVRGVDSARLRMGSLVHEPSLARASGIDRTFLIQMAKDSGPSKMSDIAERMGADANYASQYRLRLISQELIRPAGYGYVDFALPYLREYLQEHATNEV